MQLKSVIAVVLAMSGVAFAAPWQIALKPKPTNTAVADAAAATASPAPPPPPAGKAITPPGPPRTVIKLSNPHYKSASELFKSGGVPAKPAAAPAAANDKKDN
ncbi:uncharacterized protein DFL_002401 [Arthrobotrys flagrans]|uniref:Uncharacterized protein n=1 Tax=Arthrobotrys flagrans TaxID=97331 RepID=A0A437AAR8_ARTFL|nr:hypothetical protein DFL_002401 [Arthrobotrys flagrans]